MEIRVKLTPQEIVDAIWQYAKDEKEVHVPHNFEAKTVRIEQGSTQSPKVFAPNDTESYPIEVVWRAEE